MGKRPMLGVVVLLVMLLQLAVPLTALVLPDKPHRLGWQMYSGIGFDDIRVTDPEGDVVDVPWQDVLARNRRVELQWTQYLPEELCARLDESQLTVHDGDTSRTVTC